MPEASSIDQTGHEAQPGLGAAEQVSLAGGAARLILTVTVNLLVLAEVFVAMYFAAQDMNTLTPVFFKVLFSLLVPTLAGAWVARRIISRRGGS